MATVVCVAEKPSIAEAIARVLLPSARQNAGRGGLPVYEGEGVFDGRHANFRVTSVAGHVLSLDFPKRYQDWDAVEPVELFTAPTVKTARKSSVVHHLQAVAAGSDVLVLFLDCDREGENICFEVIDIVKPKMCVDARILRAKFSAVAKSDIEHAMANLVAPNRNESLAVDVRQELDLKVGVAFSRLQTRLFRGRFSDLDASLISYGPCQTPTLGFCVDRYDAILAFRPEPFWRLAAEVTKDGRRAVLSWARGRVFHKPVAAMFEELVHSVAAATVVQVTEREARKARPVPLNTVELLRIASRALGMSPSSTMHMAEQLYLRGFLSYPRTESTAYPSSFDLKKTVAAQAKHPTWGAYATELLARGLQRPRAGHDAGDHPPITPVRLATRAELSGDHARLYEMVTRHFLATVSPDCVYIATSVLFDAGDEEFTASGRRMLTPGFTAIQTYAAFEDNVLPTFSRGERLPLSRCELQEGRTTPPRPLSESELITMMEKHGIGTDASISSHIENICKRNYVVVGSGRTLQPTELGVALVHGYHRVDPELVLPKVRSSIEKQCDLVAAGAAPHTAVVEHALAVFEAKFKYFTAKVSRMFELFEAVFSPIASAGKPFSKCGKCLKYMTLFNTKPVRLVCVACAETYALPQNGLIKGYRELHCPLDGFELVHFSLGNLKKAIGKAFPLCPYCFNNPPFDGLERMGCNQCLHPTCRHSMAKNSVCPCPATEGRPHRAGQPAIAVGAGAGDGSGDDADGWSSSGDSGSDHAEAEVRCSGTLVLDPDSMPHWKMACTACNLIVHFRGSIFRVQTTKQDKCGCGATTLKVEFKRGRSPLPSGDTSYRACVVCDDLLNSLTEMREGRWKNLKLVRAERAARRAQRGGRGGGGVAGGGRGRGRGRGQAVAAAAAPTGPVLPPGLPPPRPAPPSTSGRSGGGGRSRDTASAPSASATATTPPPPPGLGDVRGRGREAGRGRAQRGGGGRGGGTDAGRGRGRGHGRGRGRGHGRGRGRGHGRGRGRGGGHGRGRDGGHGGNRSAGDTSW